MTQDIGLLILRLVVGGLLFGHGAQKLFGWFGGHGFAATRGVMGSHMRLRPATFWTVMAVSSEAGGGLLLALGLGQPLGALGVAAAMVMAVRAHWPKVWAAERGFEYPLVLLTAAITVGLIGGGRYSLDRALGIALPTPQTFLIGLVAVLLGALVAHMTRAPEPAPTPEPQATAEPARG